ncbi:DUF4019 domain-containing protein [Undibacterium sp. TS12]|uniref:DUF4019 domain-containing protein n=1 Tax=Undibacterium sp. TS12 TaxID=2908202 RepID=UPI001F4CF326|nr:DUF4019 domain-containing protein [Undibacterium sp. TS12]MCH8617525.1 DUF4019 domain-containing protein [Undibacterium sp. TS12]
MKQISIAISASLCLFSSYSQAVELAYKKISASEYELVLSNNASMTIAQAQAAMQGPATTLCGDKKAQFGKYTFKTDESKAGSINDARSASFKMMQTLNCVDALPTTAKPFSVAKLSSDDEARFRNEVKKLTVIYFSALEKGDYQAAYNMLGSSTKSLSAYPEWKARASAYQATIGKLINRDLWRITVYDNPANSQQPGVYIAVDYETRHSAAPITCGYVVWFVPPGSKSGFSLMREEYGHVTADILKNISASDLGQLRKQMGCRA